LPGVEVTGHANPTPRIIGDAHDEVILAGQLLLRDRIVSNSRAIP